MRIQARAAHPLYSSLPSETGLVGYGVQRPRRALSLLGNRLETGRLVLYGLGIGALVGFAGTAFTVAVEFLQNTLLGGITGLLPPGLPNEGGVLHAFSGERSWLLPILMALALIAVIWLERIGSRTICFYHRDENRLS